MEGHKSEDDDTDGCEKPAEPEAEPPKKKKKWGSKVTMKRKSHKNVEKKPTTSEAGDGSLVDPVVPAVPGTKRSYVIGRLSMPKKRHLTDKVAQLPEGFVVAELNPPQVEPSTSSRNDAHEKPQSKKRKLLTDLDSESQAGSLEERQTRKSQRVHQSQMRKEPEPVAQPQPKESDIYRDVVWNTPMDTNPVLDSSTLKEVADEEDQAYEEVTPAATHGDTLPTIQEENPYSDVISQPINNENISEEKINEEGKISVADFIAFNLHALLPNSWRVDTINDSTVRMACLSPFENVSVQKSIIWNGEDVKIFVHNRPLPSDNFIWDSAVIEDKENYGQVCDVLLRLATVLQFVNVCNGIILHESQWKKAEEQGKGTTEKGIYEESKCFRHSDCWLLTTEHKRCGNCHGLQRNMKDQVRRSGQNLTKDQTKINDRYRTSEEKQVKLDELEKEKKNLEKKYNRIRKRVQKLIASKSCNVSTDSSKDLARIFQESYEHMTAVERIFWSEQLKALSCQRKDSRCMRWNPFMIKVALHIRMRTTSQGYGYIRNFVKLPSDRTLYDYTHAVEAKDGIQDSTIKNLVEKSKNFQDEHLKYFNIEFDEMHVRSDIVIDKKTGDIIGYAHLKQVEKDLADLEAEISSTNSSPVLAKTVLVYLVQGVTNPLLGVVAIYPARDLTAGQLFSRTWDVVYTMESCGLKVLCLICDGAAVNKKFFRMHPGVDPLGVGSEHVYATKNLAATEERLLFFMIDPPHLLKTLRNCLANSYSHKKSRKMWKNNEDLSWLAIVNLHAISADKWGNKLTRAHIKLTPFSCMKVLYATQVMSARVARELLNEKDHPALEKYHTEELSKFVKIVNNGFDCFNGSGDIHGKRNKSNPLLLPYTTLEDPRFKWLKEKYLGFFQEWKEDTNQRKGNYTADAREKMCVSDQAFKSLHITTYGFIGAVQFMLREVNAPSIDAKQFNQDKLEQYFGNLRQSAGGSRSLSVAQVERTAASLSVQGNAAKAPLKGNTTVEKEEWIPDETPLPKLKRRK